MQMLFGNDTSALQVKIRQLEILSLLRGKNIQQIILQEENNMPVTIDIREDLRYQQGVEVGSETKSIVVAENLLKEGLAVSFVQKVTSLPIEKIEEIAHRLGKE